MQSFTVRRLFGITVLSVVAGLGSGCATGIVNKSPTYITDVSATVNGIVLTNQGGEVEYWVEYGRTAAYGKKSTERTASLEKNAVHDVSVPIDGLSGGTTWHYRLCAQDAQAGTCSKDQTFRTGGGRSGIAFRSDRDGNFEVYVMDADGSNQTNVTNSTAFDNMPAWSPDGSKIAFTTNRDGGGDTEIYVMDADGSNQTRLTNNAALDQWPAWSPDGTKIAFTSNGDGNSGVYVMDADGSDQTNLTNNAGQPAWSPDGSQIAVVSSTGFFGTDVYVMDADGSNLTNLTNNPAQNSRPAWSPDGRKIAFESNRDGDPGPEVYVMDADGSNQTNLTQNAAFDADPAWSPRP